AYPHFRSRYGPLSLVCLFPFFFQAEDGIRDRNVTGVQTCALPISSEYSCDREVALSRVGLPMVLVDPIDVPRTETPSIGATNWAGGYEATKHLLNLGHTRIRFVGGPPGARCDIVRAHGWAAAMSEA